MNPTKAIFSIILVTILVAGSLGVLLTDYPSQPFGKCLSDRGVVILYHSESLLEEQKEILGSDWDYITKINCNEIECAIGENIGLAISYPPKHLIYIGPFDKDKLSIISDCPLKGVEMEINKTDLAQCLTDKGYHLYYSTGCGWCDTQKKDFGEAFIYLNSTDCSINETECQENNVEGVPTWIKFENNTVVDKWSGYTELMDLKLNSGC